MPGRVVYEIPQEVTGTEDFGIRKDGQMEQLSVEARVEFNKKWLWDAQYALAQDSIRFSRLNFIGTGVFLKAFLQMSVYHSRDKNYALSTCMLVLAMTRPTAKSGAVKEYEIFYDAVFVRAVLERGEKLAVGMLSGLRLPFQYGHHWEIRNTRRDICPKCEVESVCIDETVVDIGVGAIRGQQTYFCRSHGEYVYTSSEDLLMPRMPVFKDE